MSYAKSVKIIFWSTDKRITVRDNSTVSRSLISFLNLSYFLFRITSPKHHISCWNGQNYLNTDIGFHKTG